MPQTIVCSTPLCPRPAVDRGRCAVCRQTTSQRGYGGGHQRARDELEATLPAPCGYGCGTILRAGSPWVAAHRVDGHPETGYIASCGPCNERAKVRGRELEEPTPVVERDLMVII